MSWGVQAPLSMRFALAMKKPFKERFRHIPPPLLDEVHASLRDMLEAGTIQPSQFPWCNAMVLVWKKDGSL